MKLICGGGRELIKILVIINLPFQCKMTFTKKGHSGMYEWLVRDFAIEIIFKNK